MNDSGSGSYSDVIEGVNWAAGNCEQGEKCVANMSLGGPASGAGQDLNAAVIVARDRRQVGAKK